MPDSVRSDGIAVEGREVVMVTGNSVRQGGWTEDFHKYQAEIMTKIKKGETEESIPIGNDSYTASQWKKIMKRVDQQIEDIKEEQAARLEKREERVEAQRVYEAAASMSGSPARNLREADKVPYSHMARDGGISYNGVTFVCDAQSNSICLGDVSDRENTLVIPLAEGGCLKVNRDNLEDLSKAIGMFSPEDINRIMRAIAKDKKARQMEQELEDEKSDVTELAADHSQQEEKEI